MAAFGGIMSTIAVAETIISELIALPFALCLFHFEEHTDAT